MRSKLGFPRARDRLARKIDCSGFGAQMEGPAASDLGEQT
jgi:hypothetical protein